MSRPRVHDLLRPVGGPHAQLLWRGYGVSAVILALLMRGDDSLLTYLRVFPWHLHATTACGLLLAATGPRLITLITTAVAWVAYLTLVIGGTDSRVDFIADEYLLYTALPVAGALSAALALRTPASDAPDLGQIAVFRIVVAAALMFAAFHKLNRDFLDPAFSCATTLARRLDAWSLPIPHPSPLAIVALELLAPLLLLRWPRLGIAGILVLAAGLGHIGPVAFNALLAASALAFLPREAIAALAPRAPRIAVLAGLTMAAAAPLSWHLYQGRAQWFPFYAFECVLIAAAFVVAFAPPVAAPSPWLPVGRAHRDLCGLLLACMILCGLGPYLGTQYRLSFAMLSNLRVDDDRWNHLLVPSWVRLRDDRLVHVLAISTGAESIPAPRNLSRVPTLIPGVFSPQELRSRAEESRRRKQRIGVTLRYRGQTHTFADLLYDGVAQPFIAALPTQRRLQSALRLSGPQTCVH